jgi:hypothetical protein
VSLPAVVPRGPVALLGLVNHFVHDNNYYLFSLLSCTFLFSCKATMHSGKKKEKTRPAGGMTAPGTLVREKTFLS